MRIAPCTLRLDVISWVIVQQEDCVNYSLKRKCTSVRGMRAADPDRCGHVGSFDNETDLFFFKSEANYVLSCLCLVCESIFYLNVCFP